MITFIPGQLISLITFPGVIFHEAAHRFFCDYFRVPVYEVCYFAPISQQSGYVIHQTTNNLKAKTFIAMGPLIINTLLCMLFSFPLMASHKVTGDIADGNPLFTFLMWIGLSAGMHAIPSNVDINNLLPDIKTALRKDFMYIFPLFLLWCMKILNFFKIIWIDLFFAFGIAFLGPLLFM